MTKSNNIVDAVILILLTLLSSYTVYLHFSEGFVIYLNLLLGAFLLLVAIGFKIVGHSFSNYAAVILFVLFAIGIINFIPFTSEFGENTHSVLWNFRFSGINPVGTIFLIVYILLNFKFIATLYNKLFRD